MMNIGNILTILMKKVGINSGKKGVSPEDWCQIIRFLFRRNFKKFYHWKKSI